jgi:GrpB-like predicted nucleotidyltransferase (UPF0157 family)
MWFETLRSFYKSLLSPYVLQVEHVGSTAVPGMIAKPIIDLDIVIEDRNFDQVKCIMEKTGFIYEGDLGISGRYAFKPMNARLDNLPPHHPYICDLHNNELKRHILFRNYLIHHPDDVLRYSRLKQQLVDALDGDRAGYIEGKASLVAEILQRASLWHQQTHKK